MLVTAINLLPFGQLDGGHLAYAVVGRRAARVSALTLGVVVLLTVQSLSWMLMALIMVGASLAFGFGHPHVIDEDSPIGSGRLAITVLAIAIFALCFMPVPITQY
jgi:membrane-associated protease RseP (regulator of RpoE activity)